MIPISIGPTSHAAGTCRVCASNPVKAETEPRIAHQRTFFFVDNAFSVTAYLSYHLLSVRVGPFYSHQLAEPTTSRDIVRPVCRAPPV